jgi:hypothetical protein
VDAPGFETREAHVEHVDEAPKEVVVAEPPIKEARRSESRSRSKHHDKAAAPAVQFEITPKGVRVISEKESFL